MRVTLAIIEPDQFEGKQGSSPTVREGLVVAEEPSLTVGLPPRGAPG